MSSHAFATITDLIHQFQEFGIFDFYLPFIIMFGIIFSILTRSKIFGDAGGTDKAAKTAKAINLIISLSAAAYIMAYTPAGITLSGFFATLFGETFVTVVTVMAVAIILYVVGSAAGLSNPLKDKNSNFGKKAGGALVAIFLLIGIAIFFSSGGAVFFPGLTFNQYPGSPIFFAPNLGISATDLAIIFLVVVTGLIIYWVGFKGEGGGKKSQRSQREEENERLRQALERQQGG